jgi:hypothetical protein
MNSHIEKYLDDLREAMRDLDKSTIQDALANAEDHLDSALKAEIAENKERNKDEIIQEIIQRYGSPEEIRDVYSDIEDFTTPVFAMEPGRHRRGFRGFVSVVAEPRAWAALLYMILSLVTGIFYFTWSATGLSLSISLLVLIIGIPIAFLFLLSVRGLGFVEGRMVEAMLGVRMPRRSVSPGEGTNWWEKFKIILSTRSTWTTLLYMMLMMPIGILYFTLVVTLLSTGLGFIGSPVVQYILNEPLIDPDIWVPFYALPVFMAFGALLIVLTLHLAKFVGRIHGRFAKAMLVS